MPSEATAGSLAALIQAAGPLFQMATTGIAILITFITFRFTRRQTFLSLINQNNSMANTVNAMVIQTPQVRDTLGKLHDFIVGCPDDAVLFMYLNYVHNTYRMRCVHAVSRQVWSDTLDSCIGMVGRLSRDQVERLLSCGYERGFQVAVLERFDAKVPVPASTPVPVPAQDSAASIHCLAERRSQAAQAA